MSRKLFHVRIADAEAQLRAGRSPREIAHDWAQAATEDAQLVIDLLPIGVRQVSAAATPPAVYAAALLFVQGVQRRILREKPAHVHAADPDSACPDCQVAWTEEVEAMAKPGARVKVTLPKDVAPWYDQSALGASWVGTVCTPNGDQLDVTTPTGEVEPVPLDYCRLVTPPRVVPE